MDSKNGLLVQNLQDGNQNMQFFNLRPPESIPTNKRPKMKEKRQKWSREELKEISYWFYYTLENPSETYTKERKYKLWWQRNKTERSYIDANNLANVRPDVMKK